MAKLKRGGIKNYQARKNPTPWPAGRNPPCQAAKATATTNVGNGQLSPSIGSRPSATRASDHRQGYAVRTSRILHCAARHADDVHPIGTRASYTSTRDRARRFRRDRGRSYFSSQGLARL